VIPLRAVGACVAISLLAACGGGGTSVPAAPTPLPVPSAGPIASASTAMNPLTSYTVYVGSVDGTTVSTELSSLSSGSAGAGGAVVGSIPADLMTTGSPLAPLAVPGAVIAFPDGSTVVADAFGNFDASQSSWAIANAAQLAVGQEVEVIVDGSNVVPSATPLDTVVNADEPSGGTVIASFGRETLAAAAPSAPPTLAKLQISPASIGMFDKEQRTFFAFGFDSAGKKSPLGKQSVTWTVANCSGAAAAGRLIVQKESSTIVYRAPDSGSAGACNDVVMASYTNPKPAAGTVGVKITASAKAYYAARDTAVLYSGLVVDANNQPLAKAIVDFFATTSSSAAGRVVAVTDKDGKFSRKIPAGRTPAFLVASRVAAGTGFKYQFYNVTVTPANATTGLTLKETTPTTRPGSGK
jgi:hypothetical protein